MMKLEQLKNLFMIKEKKSVTPIERTNIAKKKPQQ